MERAIIRKSYSWQQNIRAEQLDQQKHLSDHLRFYDQNISTVNLETEDSNSNHGKTFLKNSFFHRLCRLELTVLAKKETTRHKNQGREQSKK